MRPWVSETATFRPGFEVGLRLDGGDAESGAGLAPVRTLYEPA